jgi:glutamate--cysteine ligase
MPFYASVDIRDAGWKVAAVDANAYPAGFNNVSKNQQAHLAEHLLEWLANEHPNVEWLHIWPESHTRNKGYVENLLVLRDLLSSGGLKVTVGSPKLSGLPEVEGLTGNLKLSETTADGELLVSGEQPDLLVLNHDLSDGRLKGIGDIPVAPPQEMGWFQRRKSSHFKHAQPFIDKAAEILEIDPWLLGTHWFVSEDKCLEKDVCKIELAAQVDNCMEFLSGKYAEHGIEGEPVLFVKNDSGTYGLGIIEIRSGEELLNLSKRKVNRLTYGKGGKDAVDFLLQEGVPTDLKMADSVIEPCFYGAGGHGCSAFYRANDKKGVNANLNTPSTRFISPEEVLSGGGEDIIASADTWHALVAELAMLAMGAELAELSE